MVGIVVVVMGIVQVVSPALGPIPAYQLQLQSLLHQGVVAALALAGVDGDPCDARVAQPLLAGVVSVTQRPVRGAVLVVRTAWS